MTIPRDKSTAIVLLPPVSGGRLQDPRLATWLSRGALERAAPARDRLEIVLAALDLPYPDQGLAALRMWGQTGERPNVWIAAADPVYLEPRLDHLCLHALAGDAVPRADLRSVLDLLQETLATDTKYGFARIGSYAYVRSSEPMATARAPAYVVDRQIPNEFMPDGEDAASYRSLRSEVEMTLHENEVNKRRHADGLPPINSLWLWGGGYAPEQCAAPRLPLFADDPLLKGYWLSSRAAATPWPGSMAACLEASTAGFVAVPNVAADDIGALQACLYELRTALVTGRLGHLRLIFEDGVEAEVERWHAWRLWRRRASLLG